MATESQCRQHVSCLIYYLEWGKCEHMNPVKMFKTVPWTTTFESLFYERHPRVNVSDTVDVKTLCSCSDNEDDLTEVEAWKTSVGEISQRFNVKRIKYICSIKHPEDTCVDLTSGPAKNAFDVLMAEKRVFVEKKQSSSGVKTGLSRKDELYNNLVDDMCAKGLDFPKQSEGEGTYIVQVLTNALWYVTNQHNIINDAARRNGDVLPIPEDFVNYTGFNDLKRKKVKAMPLSATQLESHAQVLYSLMMKPVMKSSPAWVKGAQQIKDLADCFTSYTNYLKLKAKTSEKNRECDHPVRTLDSHSAVEHRPAILARQVKSVYRLLNECVINAGMEPVLFDESAHVDKMFESNIQRYRFFKDLQLSVPVDIITFSPGGSVFTTHCFVRVPNERTESQMLTEGARTLQKMRLILREFHTRAQKKAFRQKLSNVVSVLPQVADFIYKELALDQSAASHPDMQERLRLIFLGNDGLIKDLRSINPGRPSGNFDVFFEKLGEVVEEVTAADERRHNTAHLAHWISLRDLIEDVKMKCPPETPVPSHSLVRLQFAPRNPYAHTALSFTSKFDVQYKIQRRQLRLGHQDDHYCSAQLKYLKSMCIQLQDHARLFCCDDKAKVPVGEPDAAISTGVRGKKTLAPSSTTLVALDHDMGKASLTPSVVLDCSVPDSVDKSFLRGQVTVTVNDSVYQSSSPFRHAAMLKKIVEKEERIVPVLMKFTDGGTDQRNTLEAVRLAQISLFKSLNLDMLILARCAPGHSWTNPAERVMSILNLGLQNCALERKRLDSETENEIKKLGSMADLRKKNNLAAKWEDSIAECRTTVQQRFTRLALKDKPFIVIDPVSEEDVDAMKEPLRQMFPDLDLQKLQKAFTQKSLSYMTWLKNHCQLRHYNFQIRKCENEACCEKTQVARQLLQWLPDPVRDGDHFKAYEQVLGTQTTEDDRPSLKQGKTLGKVNASNPPPDLSADVAPENVSLQSTPDPPSFGDGTLCTGQNARATVECVECNKPRVVYCKIQLSQRAKVSLSVLLSEYEYTCGSPLAPPGHPLSKTVFLRKNLFCAQGVELSYYSTGNEIGRKDLCSHCASAGAVIDHVLKQNYKTVLPICDNCKSSGKLPVVQRPYGKPKK